MSSFMPQMLSLREITIRYPNKALAVSDLTLEVIPGEVFGLVGPNGAGKSSLLKCAAGLLKPIRGTVCCGDVMVTNNPRATAGHLTLMPDPLGVYNDLTASEYLEFFAMAFGLSHDLSRTRRQSAIDRLGLAPWLDHEVETLSAGWQRRLALSRVLLANTPIVLLDEPAAGLDVSARSDLLKIVRSFAAEGRTVVVTSHILPELEELADRFGIIQKGKWIPVSKDQVFFNRHDLTGSFQKGAWWLECSDSEVARILLGGDKIQPVPGTNRVRLLAEDREEAAAQVAKLVKAGQKIYHFEAETLTLAQVTREALETKA
jgi:ABC-type multidrug transport system ATPase subunit